MASEVSAPPVVLVHGLWLTPRSWEGWKERCESRGRRVLAPAWPRMPGEVEDVRRDPSALNGLGLSEIVEHYEGIVRGLDRPPVIIGHSFGGLVTELLLDRGLGAAGVAISPAPVKGVLRLPPAMIRATFPVLRSPANRHRTVGLTPKQFHYNFANTMAQDEAKAAYARYHVPGPGSLIFQAAFANFNPRAANKVDVHNGDRPPLLVIGYDQVTRSPPRSARRPPSAWASRRPWWTTTSSRDGPISPARPAGRRSPTTRSTGPTATPARPRRASKRR
jgi:pimeloyl-ACP methyl ester carboxylesterase